MQAPQTCRCKTPSLPNFSPDRTGNGVSGPCSHNLCYLTPEAGIDKAESFRWQTTAGAAFAKYATKSATGREFNSRSRLHFFPFVSNSWPALSNSFSPIVARTLQGVTVVPHRSRSDSRRRRLHLEFEFGGMDLLPDELEEAESGQEFYDPVNYIGGGGGGG
jgi:hypothetical protein